MMFGAVVGADRVAVVSRWPKGRFSVHRAPAKRPRWEGFRASASAGANDGLAQLDQMAVGVAQEAADLSTPVCGGVRKVAPRACSAR